MLDTREIWIVNLQRRGRDYHEGVKCSQTGAAAEGQPGSTVIIRIGELYAGTRRSVLKTLPKACIEQGRPHIPPLPLPSPPVTTKTPAIIDNPLTMRHQIYLTPCDYPQRGPAISSPFYTPPRFPHQLSSQTTFVFVKFYDARASTITRTDQSSDKRGSATSAK